MDPSQTATSTTGRQSRGRQKIPIQKIESQDDMYATFSKRRLGLYKKASELCTLCGVDIGLLIFSPTNNPYSFFHPSMDSVLDRHRNSNVHAHGHDMAQMMESHTRARVDELNRSLDEVLDLKDKEIEKEKQLDEASKNREKSWWEVPVESLDQDRVKEWMNWFQDLNSRISNRIEELKNGTSSSSSAINPPGPPIADYHEHANSGLTFGPNYNPNINHNYGNLDPNPFNPNYNVPLINDSIHININSSTGGGYNYQRPTYQNNQQNYNPHHHGFQYGQGQVMDPFGAGPSSSHHHQYHQQHGFQDQHHHGFQDHQYHGFSSGQRGGDHDMFGGGGSGSGSGSGRVTGGFGFELGPSLVFPGPPSRGQGGNPSGIGGSRSGESGPSHRMDRNWP